MLNSVPPPAISNATISVSQHRALPRAAGGVIDIHEYKNPFELIRVVLNELRDTQYELVQALTLRKNSATNDVAAQQTHEQLTQAEKALSNYEAELNKFMQQTHQLITRILDAIR
ncbi:hypothetical protein [Mycoavidus sp. B2-EB]|uniref:hypothetical protein n=1 Tax=Mycoavidus sp. B2-EB TaxID=2651972 RepID=UPI001623BE4C|nr:hypothetical protein [Mycoavidus sp. B2-EB]BBO59068.1 hypothetical protein MPB2EB_0169 [Mycoavidus sp. B2-EB]